MNIIFQIDGGLGKSIMATAMIKVIKKRYKNSNLIIVSGYPDVFLNNPNVSEIYTPNQVNGLFNKFIKDQKCKIFVADPYRHGDFILESKEVGKYGRVLGVLLIDDANNNFININNTLVEEGYAVEYWGGKKKK